MVPHYLYVICILKELLHVRLLRIHGSIYFGLALLISAHRDSSQFNTRKRFNAIVLWENFSAVYAKDYATYAKCLCYINYEIQKIPLSERPASDVQLQVA